MTQTNFELSAKLAITREVLERAAADIATVTNLEEYFDHKYDAECIGALALLSELSFEEQFEEKPLYYLASA